MKNLISHIQSVQPDLPRQQKILCDYICSHIFEASRLTIAELAEKAGVGTATVTRTINSLGYSSYNQFKSDLREQAFSNASSSYGAYWSMHQEQTFDISSELTSCRDMVQGLNNPFFTAQINAAADAVLAARRIYILGLRTSSITSLCLEYRLADEGLDVYSLSHNPEFVFDRLIDLREDDLMIAIASKPASKKTMDVMKICHKNHIPSLLITTAPFPELESLASCVINTNTFDSLLAVVPPVLAVELLSCTVSRRRGSKSQSRYHRIEKLIQENDVAIWG